MAGRLKGPRTVAAPFTSSAATGVLVLIPILAVVPLPVCVTAEGPRLLLSVHLASVPAVPEPPTEAGVMADASQHAFAEPHLLISVTFSTPTPVLNS